MNTLAITGPEEERDRFKEFAKGPGLEKDEPSILDANKFIPMPESLNIEAGSQDMLYDIWFGTMPNCEWLPKDREAAKEQMRKDYREKNPPQDADKIAEQYKFNVDNYGCKTWYDWAVRMWGSKWNFCNPSVSESETDLIYTFDTAWSPMIPVIRKMGEMFPKLRFQLDYAEPGCWFQGTYIMEDGICTMDDCHDYIPSEEEQAEMDEMERLDRTEEIDLSPRYERLGEANGTKANDS
jgi:hypothetical protein